MPPDNWRQITSNRKEDIISQKVFVGNLSDDTTQIELEDIFSEAGQVLEIFMPTDHSTGHPRGFAFVEFADEASVTSAVEKLDGHMLNGRSLRVSLAEDRPQRSQNTGHQGPKFGRNASKSSKSKGSRRNIRARKRGG
ncbi:RNA recognition motif domain-containing protein [Chloroflexota bacterium]